MIKWIRQRYALYKARKRLRNLTPEQQAELVVKAGIDLIVWEEVYKIFKEELEKLENENKTD